MKERTLEWTDKWGDRHLMTEKGAIQTLRKLYEEWPGGIEEIESCTSWVIKQLQEANRKLEDLACRS